MVRIRQDEKPLWVGVDLGTTNSVVAYVDHAGIPTTVVNFEGDVLTPSKLFIEGEHVVAGREAVKAGGRQADKYAESFKRYMGEDHHPPQVDGRDWRPEMLSALLLRRLRQDTERQLGRVDGAVITVPAFFDESRRRATSAAAEIAGWTVIDLINEPTAAALAYAHRAGRSANGKAPDENLLVFDLGGGTMDATLLRIAHGEEYRTIATDGEVQLGGIDWDRRLRITWPNSSGTVRESTRWHRTKASWPFPASPRRPSSPSPAGSWPASPALRPASAGAGGHAGDL